MPQSLYKSLKLGPLKETSVIMQLADMSNAYPEGVVEDVLVLINWKVFLLIFTPSTWRMTHP